ncbi:MAG TPA: ferredoxin [Streptosporangiaceae bacterium]
MTAVPSRLLVNPVACAGHGVCAELLPELVTLDEWGYPVIAGGPVPARLARQARRAVRDCPALALLLAEADQPGRTGQPARPRSEENQKRLRISAQPRRAG